MNDRRTHCTTTTDGVTLGGTVHGRGPALVLLQGIVGDGDLDWAALAPHLSERFTCHLPSLRGRGLSSGHTDLSPRRLVADVLSYVDSLDEPVGLVGWSLGAELALAAAAAEPGAVRAVTAYEPVVSSLMDEPELAALGGAVARVVDLASAGDLAAAARAFASWPFSSEETATADDAGYFAASAPYVPELLALLQLLQQETATVDSPAVLSRTSTPVLVLHGSRTSPFFVAGARHVAGHLPHAEVQEVADAGHAGPLTHPRALADAITAFFSGVPQPA